MALRFQCPGANIALAGTTFTHGLALTPIEWGANLYSAQAGVQTLYRVGAVTSAQIVFAASGAAASGDVFASYPHTLIQ